MKSKNKEISMADKVIDVISGIFLPLANLLSASGILKGLLMMLVAMSVITKQSETYLVLNAMSDSLFYFLPIVLAFTASKRFGVNPFTCVIIAGIFLYPSLNKVLEAGTTIHFMGIPLRGATYHSSVIPIILAAALLIVLERFFYKILPDIIKGFFTPMLCILIVGFVTLFLFGPAGSIIGDSLASVYEYIYDLSPVVAGMILGIIIQPMVIFGFHWSFVLVSMNNVMITGHDTILAFFGVSVFAQAGAAFAVMLKSKDKSLRSICASATVSALFGITEPAIFSVNLPRKRPMIAACIGGGIGGAIAGFSGVQASAYAFPSIVTFPIFIGNGFALYMIACITSIISAFLITYFMKFDIDIIKKEKSATENSKEYVEVCEI